MNTPSLAAWCRSLLLTAMALFVVLASHAQPSSGGTAPTPTPTPLDGGASLLLASGVAYAVRQLRTRRPFRRRRAQVLSLRALA